MKRTEQDTNRLFGKPGVFAVLCGPLRVHGSGRCIAAPARRALPPLFVSLVALSCWGAPAWANSLHGFAKEFGGQGPGAGQMQLAPNSGVAVNAATHNVYVADTGNHRVDEFNENGAFVRAWGWGVDGVPGFGECSLLTCQVGESGSQPGEFEDPQFIAVDNTCALQEQKTGKVLSSGECASLDPSNGEVYVADTGTQLVTKFTAEGALVTTWGVAGQLGTSPVTVATGTGNLTTGSSKIGELTATSGSFHSADELSGEGIQPGTHLGFDRELSQPATITKEHVGLTAQRALGGYAGVAVGPTGDLLVATATSEIVFEFDQSGTFLQEFARNEGNGGILAGGLAVNGIGDVYFNSYEGVLKLAPGGGNLSGGVSGGPGTVAGLAANQATNELLVDRGAVIEAFGPAGEALGSFGPPQLSGGAGVAIDPAGAVVYAANTATDHLDAYAPVIEVGTTAASEVTATTATLTGDVNPEGGRVLACEFEYETLGEYETLHNYAHSVPCEHPGAPELGDGSSPVSVHANVGGLGGGTAYRFRLVAVHEDTATHEETSVGGEGESFSTLPVPVVANAEATNLSAGGAELRASVDPEGLQVTRCVFEYGTSTKYGSVAKCEQKLTAIGAGVEPVPVSAQIDELLPSTSYHWRLAVRDKNGETTSLDHTFVYSTAGSELPDGRAYEMVTPVFKNGALLTGIPFEPAPAVSENGLRVMSRDIQCFDPAESCNATNNSILGNMVAFTRGATGWTGSELAPPATRFGELTPFAYSAEEGTALFTAPAGPAGEEEWIGRDSEGAFTAIGPATPPGVSNGSGIQVTVSEATANLSHLVWDDNLSGGAAWPFDRTQEGKSLYEYAGACGGQPQCAPFLVGVTGPEHSTELLGVCGSALGAEDNGYAQDALSADGESVFVSSTQSGGACSAAPPVKELFDRVDGEHEDAHTVAISEPDAPQVEGEAARGQQSPPDDDCTGECLKNISTEGNWREAEFEGASEDGSLAYFLSAQQLTNEAVESTTNDRCPKSGGACNLYLYDFNRPAGHELIDVSAPQGAGESPGVQGVVAISADGSHVYFIAQGVLTRQERPGCAAAFQAQGVAEEGRCHAREGASNLYVYDTKTAQTSFIAIMSDGDGHEWEEPEHSANVTPDGRFLVFVSRGDLTPDTHSGGSVQVFRYAAAAGALTRVSTGAQGYDDDGNGGIGPDAIVGALPQDQLGHFRGDPSMSNDGSYVFFQSPRALTPHALDDVVIGHLGGTNLAVYAENVYEWHEGQVSLISDGRDAVESGTCEDAFGDEGNDRSSVCLLGSDASGHNVFFTTADQLVPKDTDTQDDIYDARICEPEGGQPCAPEPPPSSPPCQGEQCHGIPAATPSLLAPGTASFNGEGNVTSSPPSSSPAKKVAKKTAKCRRVLVKRRGKKRTECVKKKSKKPAKKSALSKRRTGR